MSPMNKNMSGLPSKPGIHIGEKLLGVEPRLSRIGTRERRVQIKVGDGNTARKVHKAAV